METLLKILIAVLLFSALVLFHEFGHFLLAKAVGVGVTEFALGMGPILVSWGKGETKYAIKALPFGGSCSMVGEDADDPAPNAFNNKPAWARFLVVAAGPVFNFILAFLVSLVLTAAGGLNTPMVNSVTGGSGAEAAGLRQGDIIRSIGGKRIYLGRDIMIYELNRPLDGTPLELVYERDGERHEVLLDTHSSGYRIGISYNANESACALQSVSPDSPAEAAGLKVGDVILAINGTAVAGGNDLQQYLQEHALDGSALKLKLGRGDEVLETELIPAPYETNSLGFDAYFYYDTESLSLGSVLGCSLAELRYWLEYTFMSLKMLLTGSVGIRDLSGPVGIVEIIGESVDAGMESGGIGDALLNLMTMAVLLNVNLGMMNLLPIPALDGGRLIFILFELLTGKRFPAKWENYVHLAGFILLMLLMVAVMFSDVLKLFGR